jgi:hypothetical protein
MKRTTSRRKLSNELSRKRVLRLAKETVTILRSDELSRVAGAVASCPTDSVTTFGTLLASRNAC